MSIPVSQIGTNTFLQKWYAKKKDLTVCVPFLIGKCLKDNDFFSLQKYSYANECIDVFKIFINLQFVVFVVVSNH